VRQLIDDYLVTTEWGQPIWRQVPVNPDCLGPMARQTLPSIWQMLLTHPTLEGDELERQLYLLRRRLRQTGGEPVWRSFPLLCLPLLPADCL
jgi:glutamate synthase (ferredoxin)